MAWNPAKSVILSIESSFIDDTLSDFPIVVTVSSGVGINDYNLMEILTECVYADRKKIAFFAGGDQFSGTQCYTEIEHWDTEYAILHVQIPSISSATDTTVYFYYDSDRADNTVYVGDTGDLPAKAVWDDDFDAVYHMNDDPTGGSLTDSTSNSNDGTPVGMGSSNLIAGKVGKCLDFVAASSDYVELGNFQDNATVFTWELLVSSTQSIDDANCYQLPVMLGTQQGSGSSNDALFCVKAGDLAWYDEWGAGCTDTNQSISDGEWYHVAVTRNGTAVKVYKNGSNIGNITTGSNGISTAGLELCKANWTSARFFDGSVDEVRLSSAARTPAWVKASYYSTFDALITYSAGVNYYFDGYVKEQGVGVIRTVIGHRRDNGEVMFVTTSSGAGGYFYGATAYSGTHYVVCLDSPGGESYNLLAYDNVVPTTISG